MHYWLKQIGLLERVVLGLLLASILFLVYGLGVRDASVHAQSQKDSIASAKAFLQASGVFQHPRCRNCHPQGDHPLVGDNGRPHHEGVKRGPEGKGIEGLECSGCHKEENQAGKGNPPGAPGWHLPSEKMPLIFQNRTPGQLCAQLKDPARNGGRTVAEIVTHVREHPLVLWGWDPGQGRKPVSMPHKEFVKAMSEWAAKGAACPKP